MPTLTNFPMLNQLSDTSEANNQFDCVPTSIAACMEYLLGAPFDGGAIKDAVYGASYQGGTSADQYVNYAKAHGVIMTPLDGTPAQLVADIRFWLGQGRPLIATEPDPYAKPSLGWTHVVAFYGYDTGSLTCLDPYGGHPVTLSDAEWTARLQFNQVWKFEKIGGKPTMSGTPSGWRDDGHTLYSPSHIAGGPEVPITGPFRDYVLANAWRPSDRAIETGHHVNELEYSNQSLGGGFRQQFLWSLLEKPDAGSFAGKVIYAWSGVEANYLRAGFEAQLAEIATLKQEIAAHQPGLDAAKVQERLAALGKVFQEGGDLAAQPIQ